MSLKSCSIEFFCLSMRHLRLRYCPCLSLTALPALVNNKSCAFLMKIEQHNLRMLLHSFEDNFRAVCRNVKVANIKV